MKLEKLKGKNILIMGLGKFGGGLDCAKFASSIAQKVIVTDMADEKKLIDAVNELRGITNIEFRLGRHEETDFTDSDIIIANPAVRPDNPFLEKARQNGVAITSQIAIFMDNCAAEIIGITGANGKSTTTKLTWHLLDFASKNADVKFGKVWLGGNIGNMPLLTELGSVKPEDLVVLEISSFQAEQLAAENLAPETAAITNLTPNHLDRHGTFEAYCQAKESLFSYQNIDGGKPAVSIFNGEDEITSGWFEKYNSENNRQCIKFHAGDVPENVKKGFPLPGEANLSNLAAAMAISKTYGVETETIAQAVKSFKGLPHRLEFVAQANGVKWYNDSISTTPPSTIVGLEAFEEPVILIAGGYDKKLPFDEMGITAARKAKAAILIGVTADKIAEAIKNGNGKCDIYKEDTFIGAINKANELSENGDVVLMSPACASYDMFDNFQQRGDIFRDTVQNICREDTR
ncbi:MAG: UDP-N-acetylmuramoyl-L-alanine--D-glutamate ligase [Sedimentisphaeraceae bacterium JB056]